jgi:hypothetical protein
VSRPVYEPTTQRQIRKQGFSADQLFRRPAPPSEAATVKMPMAWSSATAFVMDDDTDYAITCLSSGFANTSLGMADRIKILNDPDDLTFYVNEDPNFCLTVHDDSTENRALYQFTTMLDFSANFTGKVSVFADTTFDIWSPVAPLSGNLPLGEAWPDAYNFGGRLFSATAYLDPSVGVVLQNMISIVVNQQSGVSRTVTYGWAMVTKLSLVDPTARTYTP